MLLSVSNVVLAVSLTLLSFEGSQAARFNEIKVMKCAEPEAAERIQDI